MHVAPGTRLGPYEIVAPIGAGGMGEVWRARDARMDRDVAIKILPPAFAADADRLRRFQQEARAAGTLNHPNLVTVHDLGSDDGTPYVVMELLEGETLRDKIEHDGAAVRLPVRKAVDYSVQIAGGLAAAHEKGIVHRDLKPENIFVTKDGRAKILDFGLAKVAVPQDSSATDARTQHRDTSPGTVLGTAGYMSPEQVRGRQVDHRSDIFSFGAILYEMLAGRRAFQRESSVETMSAILKEDPPELHQSGTNIPPAIDIVVRHCLEKNPEERFQSARDLAFDLQRISSTSGSSPAIAARPSKGRWIAGGIAVALVAAAVILAWRGGHRVVPLQKAQVRKFTLLTNQPGVEEFPSLAPDGKTFVYVSSAAGKPDIYLQRVDGRKAINLTKDSGFADSQPAFSPDGSQIAFRSERDGGGIFLMGATGESVRRLTDFGFNPAWSPEGSEIAVSNELIDLQPGVRAIKLSRLSIVNVRTGARRELSANDAVQPSWSPHGDRIAYWGITGEGGQRDLFTIDPHASHPEATVTRLTNDAALDWNPVWSADGRTLYFGSDRDGTMNLWRMPIDERSGKGLGPPEPVSLPTRFAAHFTVARETGALAYADIGMTETLWRAPFDPQSFRLDGMPSPILGGAMLILGSADVSPDGKWIAFSNLGTQEDLYVVSSDGKEMRQLTNDPERDRGPAWSADGKLLYFYSQRGPRYDIWSIRADGSELRQLSHLNGASLWWPRLMPDGKSLAVFNGDGIYRLPMNADGSATRLEPLLVSPDRKSVLFWPRISPDGSRFVGVNSVGGIAGVDGGLWLYSPKSKSFEQLVAHDVNQLAAPQWLPDGRNVLFLIHQELKVIDVESRKTRSVALPRPIRSFSIAPDGRTIYLNEVAEEGHIWLMTSR